MRIGIDVDGVLADFQPAYKARILSVTGRNLYPDGDYDSTFCTWFHEIARGYTQEELDRVWVSIAHDRSFWQTLSPYPDTALFLAKVAASCVNGLNDLYFVTARPGRTAKQQTEQWLAPFLNNADGKLIPTVLIATDKATVAAALSLDIYIDDRFENAASTAERSRATTACLLNRPWNQKYGTQSWIMRIQSLHDIFTKGLLPCPYSL